MSGSLVDVILSKGPTPTSEGETVTEGEGEDERPDDAEDDSGSGCGSKMLKAPRRFLGDWLLVGLSLLTLTGSNMFTRHFSPTNKREGKRTPYP